MTDDSTNSLLQANTATSAVSEPPSQLRVRNRQTLFKSLNKKRTKVLHFAPRSDSLFDGRSKFVRLYSGLQSNDVVLGGSSHLGWSCPPGNKRYRSILHKHHEKFLRASGFDRRMIVQCVAKETQKADPPARFIARRFGRQQWIGMNNDEVEKSILQDLHNLKIPGTFPTQRKVKIHQPKQPTKNTHSKKALLPPQQHPIEATTLPPMTYVLVPRPLMNAFFCLPEMAEDRCKMSDYNLLLLQNLEMFQATPEDAAISRGKGVVGQLGIRCRHCAVSGNHKGVQSTSYPGRIDIAEFNISIIGNKHFAGIGTSNACPNIPPDLRRRIVAAKATTKSQTSQRGGSGIKRYFTGMARLCGIVNTATGLKLTSPPKGNSGAFKTKVPCTNATSPVPHSVEATKTPAPIACISMPVTASGTGMAAKAGGKSFSSNLASSAPNQVKTSPHLLADVTNTIGLGSNQA